MITELAEDDTARLCRISGARELSRMVDRASLRFGLPSGLLAGALVYYFLPEEPHIAFAFCLIPLPLMVGFRVRIMVFRLLRTRWMIDGRGIRLRGYKIGRIVWKNVTGWRTDDLENLAGYYRLSVTCRRSGSAEIILEERARPSGSLGALIPVPRDPSH